MLSTFSPYILSSSVFSPSISSVNLCGKTCEKEEFCFHCDGNHSPASRRCPRYRFEEEVVETANNEHISIGSAKRIVMAANSSQ